MPKKMCALLKIENAVKVFDVARGMFGEVRKLRAVDGVSLTLEPGQSLGLVGESGCGKSTLGRLACGLLNPTSGNIELHGKALPRASSRSWARGHIQMVFQDPASSLNPRMKALNSIAEPLVPLGIGMRERRKKSEEMLDLVGLAGMGDRYPHEFSGGQRQRIAIARALITHPEVIVCDEPVSALDASVQAQILNLLREVQERFSLSYLFISHDLCVVGFMCQHISVMYLGQFVESAPAAKLFQGPAHPYSEALLAAMPEGEQVWKKGSQPDRLPPILNGELPSPLAPPTGCRFHPRCPKAMEICARLAPQWHEIEPGWQARCHLYDNEDK